MCWVADTGNGCFEAESLRELSDQIARHYAEDDEQICNIEEVYWQNAWGGLSTLSATGLSIFIDHCESTNQDLIQHFKEEEEGQRQLRSDYYAGLL